MRMTFSTPVTPTRDRLTWVEGRRAWTSLPRRVPGSVIGQLDDSYVQSEANRTSRCTMARVGWMPWTLPPTASPFAVLTAVPKHTQCQTAHTGQAVVEGARVDGEARGRGRTSGGTCRSTLSRRRGAARAGHRGT